MRGPVAGRYQGPALRRLTLPRQHTTAIPHYPWTRRLAARPRGDYSAVMSSAAFSRDPEIMGGAAVFPGTRVPVQTLLDHLEAGESIDDFLEGFPSVTREQVIVFLEAATERLVAAAT